MPYRVLPEDWAAIDPSAGTAGGSRVFHDGTTTPPWIDRPGQSKEAYVVSEALRLMTVPVDQIRMMRPPVPQVLFPITEGYDTTPLGINEVLDTNRWEPQRRSWVSGVIRYPRKSDAQADQWSGTARNMNSSLNPGG